MAIDPPVAVGRAHKFVIPAKAGIQGTEFEASALDPRFRGGDGK
jgi:hypothetical protein